MAAGRGYQEAGQSCSGSPECFLSRLLLRALPKPLAAAAMPAPDVVVESLLTVGEDSPPR
jgi:hypothetical protein